MDLVVIFGAFLLFGFLAFNGFRFYLIKKYKEKNKEEKTVFKVFVDQTNEVSPLATETILAAIHSSAKDRGFSDWFLKKPVNRVSFEFCNIDQKIGLYVFCKKSDKDLIQGQLYAQYPGIEIKEVEDYSRIGIKNTHLIHGKSIEKKDLSSAIGAELTLKNDFIYPIKRYFQFEDGGERLDPIAGIFAGISRLNATNEQAWAQVVISPIGKKWREKGRELIKEKEGKEEGDNSSDDKVDRAKETPSAAASSKIARLGFEVNVRIVYLPRKENQKIAQQNLKEIVSSFYQFNQMHLNSFYPRLFNKSNKIILKRFQNRSLIKPDILNTEEIATLWHIPDTSVKTPNLEVVSYRKLEAPLNLPNPDNTEKTNFTMLGKTNFRGDQRYFGIKNVDRRRHIYIIGKTGMGKSTILENMIFSDIQAGKGVAVIDPHGDLAEAVVSFVPKKRTNDMVLFDPSDTAFPVSFNMLECKNPDQYDIIASGLLGVFKKMYADSWGPRLEHILRNTILALVEVPGTTMLGILRMYTDPGYRSWVVKQVKNPSVVSFWNDEFANMQPKQQTEAIAPIQNKVGQFLSSNMIRNIFGQKKSSIDLRFAMDKKKIIVINLSKGKIGEDNSSLLGSMMITKFQIDAMSRANIAEKERVDHYLYVDEFQNFATDSFSTILSEARKYRLNLTMANQYISQMSDEVKGAVFGNVGSIVTFQVGYDDAVYFENQFGEEVSANNIVSIPKYSTYMKIMLDGMPTKTFSAATLPPPDATIDEEQIQKTIKVCRERYGKPRAKVEEDILAWAKGVS